MPAVPCPPRVDDDMFVASAAANTCRRQMVSSRAAAARGDSAAAASCVRFFNQRRRRLPPPVPPAPLAAHVLFSPSEAYAATVPNLKVKTHSHTREHSFLTCSISMATIASWSITPSSSMARRHTSRTTPDVYRPYEAVTWATTCVTSSCR